MWKEKPKIIPVSSMNLRLLVVGHTPNFPPKNLKKQYKTYKIMKKDRTHLT